MSQTYQCEFCGQENMASGIINIKNDGTKQFLCSKKCRVNLINLKRDPRKFKWSESYVKGGVKKGKNR